MNITPTPSRPSVLNHLAWGLCILFHLVFIGVAIWWTVSLLGPSGGGLGIFVAVVPIIGALWMITSLALVMNHRREAFTLLSIATVVQAWGVWTKFEHVIHPRNVWETLITVLALSTFFSLLTFFGVRKR